MCRGKGGLRGWSQQSLDLSAQCPIITSRYAIACIETAYEISIPIPLRDETAGVSEPDLFLVGKQTQTRHGLRCLGGGGKKTLYKLPMYLLCPTKYVGQTSSLYSMGDAAPPLLGLSFADIPEEKVRASSSTVSHLLARIRLNVFKLFQ